jgi:CheY-like chemotaxis protein
MTMRYRQSKNHASATAPARRAVPLLPAFVVTALAMGLFCHFVTGLAPFLSVALAAWFAGSVCLCLHAIARQRQPRKPALIMAEMLDIVDGRDRAHLAQHGRDGADTTRGPASASTPATVAVPRILLVDDNPMNRQLALQRLHALGYAADGAADGESALLAVRDARYGLVLMDCQMPDMDGFETTRRIRRTERGGDRHLPVIAWTALEYDPQRCFAAGMDDYLAKPLRDGQLEALLSRWLPRS